MASEICVKNCLKGGKNAVYSSSVDKMANAEKDSMPTIE